jgi:glycosyltransferase involved in cell wall biosynthesis
MRLLDAGFRAAQVVVKPHFVSDPGPRPAPPSRSRTVLFVGRMSADKGPAALLDAWAGLPSNDLELVCIGTGPLHDSLAQQQIGSVRFVGPLPRAEVRAWMLRARVLVAPSPAYETFGLVVAEAISAGLPVIVPRSGALREVAADAALEPELGETVGNADDQLTRSLSRVYDDSIIDVAGARGRARFLAHYTTTVGLTRLMHIYQSIVPSPSDVEMSSSTRTADQ